MTNRTEAVVADLIAGRWPSETADAFATRVRALVDLAKLDGHQCKGNAHRTHCPAGHPYDAVNTYVAPSGRRHCRQCQRDRWAARRTVHPLAQEVSA